MFISADGSLKAKVITADPDQKIRVWLWSYVDRDWRQAADLYSVEELARFVDLATLEEVK